MKQETNIFLVRHGETEWNTQNRLQGNQDSPLTRNGIDQAHEARKILEHYAIDQAYVSPLKRAKDTVEIILKGSKLNAVITNNLREINLGPWEGKTRGETELSHPDEYSAFWESPDLFNLPGAENFQNLQHRVVEQIDSIFAKGKNKNILIVSHWIAIKVSIAHYSSIPLTHLSSIADPVNGGFLRLSKQGNDVFVH